jgi:hypothetical protein
MWIRAHLVVIYAQCLYFLVDVELVDFLVGVSIEVSQWIVVGR